MNEELKKMVLEAQMKARDAFEDPEKHRELATAVVDLSDILIRVIDAISEQGLTISNRSTATTPLSKSES